MWFMQQDTEPEDMCKNYRYILVLLWLWMYYCILGLGLSLFVHTHYSFCVITYVAVYDMWNNDWCLFVLPTKINYLQCPVSIHQCTDRVKFTISTKYDILKNELWHQQNTWKQHVCNKQNTCKHDKCIA